MHSARFVAPAEERFAPDSNPGSLHPKTGAYQTVAPVAQKQKNGRNENSGRFAPGAEPDSAGDKYSRAVGARRRKAPGPAPRLADCRNIRPDAEPQQANERQRRVNRLIAGLTASAPGLTPPLRRDAARPRPGPDTPHPPRYWWRDRRSARDCGRRRSDRPRSGCWPGPPA